MRFRHHSSTRRCSYIDRWLILCVRLIWLLLLLFLVEFDNNVAVLKGGPPIIVQAWSTKTRSRKKYDYDLTIIGAGAAGLFAYGTAKSMFGLKKVCLIDHAKENIGGDCTNAACVPSKAWRSFARYHYQQQQRHNVQPQRTVDADEDNNVILSDCQEYVSETVQRVRRRENSSGKNRTDHNNIYLGVNDCHFIDPHTLQFMTYDDDDLDNNNVTTTTTTSTHKNITSRKFLLATGASPVVPDELAQQAQAAHMPKIETYRTLLNPELAKREDSLWTELLIDAGNTTKTIITKRLLIVGGGPTACELTQSLTRTTTMNNPHLGIDVVAPELLSDCDAHLQQSALHILFHDNNNIHYHRGRLLRIRPDKTVEISTTTMENHDNNKGDDANYGIRVLGPFDSLLFCLGRKPTTLDTLQLDRAGIIWNEKDGVVVRKNLRSVSAPHVYAAGDCCSQVKSMSAGQAAWTGFHAIRNMELPSLLLLGVGSSSSIHRYIPRVVYTDPEIATVGLSYQDCVQRYGADGFASMLVPETANMDRADMDRIERDTNPCFIELRASKTTGAILGFSGCGPAAAELANSVGIALTNRLTVSDIARSAHSYPSHGYFLYRIALSMALSSPWGVLEACGPAGKVVSRIGRLGAGGIGRIKRFSSGRRGRRIRNWQANGAGQVLYLRRTDNNEERADVEIEVVTFLDVYKNATMRQIVEEAGTASSDGASRMLSQSEVDACLQWLADEP